MDAKKAKISGESEGGEITEFMVHHLSYSQMDVYLYPGSPPPSRQTHIKNISPDVITTNLTVYAGVEAKRPQQLYKDEAITQIARILPQFKVLEYAQIHRLRSMDHWIMILKALAKCKKLRGLWIGGIEGTPIIHHRLVKRQFDWTDGELARRIRDILLVAPLTILCIHAGFGMTRRDLDIISEGTRANKTLREIYFRGVFTHMHKDDFAEFSEFTKLEYIYVQGMGTNSLNDILRARRSRFMQTLILMLEARKQGKGFKNVGLIRMITEYL